MASPADGNTGEELDWIYMYEYTRRYDERS